MKSEMPGYLKEIENVGWIQELIMERFDNALELMTPNSIIYGGAVRDCIANKELVGDLDLSVPIEDFNVISESFHTNPKWIPSDFPKEDRISEDSGGEQPILKVTNSGDLCKKFAPMSAVSSFVTTNGKIVQLIASKYQDRDALQSAIYVARMVDIICCGMIMLYDGRVFEAVPGAYQDCIDGVLRINKSSDTIYLDAIGTRVEKLVGRGWKNTIDVNKVIKEVEENREKAKRKEQRIMEMRNKRNITPSIDGLKEHNFMYSRFEKKPIFGGFMQEISKQQIDRAFSGSSDKGVNLLGLLAEKERINMRVKQTPLGNIFYETADGIQSHSIQQRLQQYYEKHSNGKHYEPSFKKSISTEATGIIEAPSSASWGSTSGGKLVNHNYTYTVSTSSTGYSSPKSSSW